MKDDALTLAEHIRRWLDRPEVDADVLTASINCRLHEEVMRVFPDARRFFGAAVIRAATRPAPEPRSCHWCTARKYTNVLKIDRAHRVLLGEPCADCRKWARDQLRARVEASAQAQVGGRSGVSRRGGRGTAGAGPNVTSSPALASFPSGHDPYKPCARCRLGRAAVQHLHRTRHALTASAAVAEAREDPGAKVWTALIDAALTPHDPARWAGRVAHDGTGIHANCPCQSCCLHRKIIYRKLGVI
jgi:hypothetical protein